RPWMPKAVQRAFTFGVLATLALAAGGTGAVRAQSPYQSSSDFAARAAKLRENALLKVEPQVFVPTSAPRGMFGGARLPWKENIVTTIFWIGELPTARNPTPNHASCWDSVWASNYGGYDNPDPSSRRNFIPVAFTPRQNPFYIALPYNDTTRGTTKPEARLVIPWFKQYFQQEGHSVCKGHWVAIRYGERVAYAQWEDAGPFRTDHYQYVFGQEYPRPNLNHGAGLDISPAVRDYLGINPSSSYDVTSWRFVEPNEVPSGPWKLYGDNNIFASGRTNPGAVRVQK
ncbi:MAG: hypothetical protein JO117_08510, partial [Verrucomicrobia bacterium]|nr:hypothetical protein [Verrucomicrobiota bacterium]